jgi:hypothetical protein
MKKLIKKLVFGLLMPAGVTMVNINRIPKYLAQLRDFKAKGGRPTRLHMILSDYQSQAGFVGDHYFHQDLLVAGYVFQRQPERHIDIGSRIGGFVAHVASFRKIEVMDVRDLKSSGHENIKFIRADMMDPKNASHEIADSISCLHALEHFGLGRYGDPIDPDGHRKGFNNMINMLKLGGLLYISFPIVKEDEVHFNAHRYFSPKSILGWAINPRGIKLERFDYIDDEGVLHRDHDLNDRELHVAYGLGIYTFRKL